MRSANLSVTISIALVLFLVGIFGVLVLNARALAKELREDFTFSLYLKSDAPEAEVRQLLKELQLKPYVKETEYITKEEAAEVWQKELGEDFLDFLDFNPLSDHIDVRLKSDFVTTTSINSIKAEMEKVALITELGYDQNLIKLVNENIKRLGLMLLGAILVLLLVSIALINSSIRLTIYSRRFLIKTMQLVGATRGFIQKPFLITSITLGISGAVVALVLLLLVGAGVGKYYPDLLALANFTQILIVFVFMLVLGILISLASTWLAVNKFLKIKTDEIHY